MRKIFTQLCLWLAVAVPAVAQVLDPNFRPGEVLQAGGVTQVIQQPDGGRVVVGRFTLAENSPVLNVVRYLPNGNLDYGFMQRLGQVEFSSNFPTVRQLASGKLLLCTDAGNITTPTLQRRNLMRLQANGTPDPTFDAGTGGGSIYALLIQPDGKILLGGTFTSFSGTACKGIVRLLPDGQIDATFQSTTLGSVFSSFSVHALALQPDGKILVGGDFMTPARALVRLLPNGQWDSSFAVVAGTNNSTSGATVARALAVQPDGKILVGGRSVNEFNGRTGGFQRLLPSGATDLSFQPPAGTECFGSGANTRIYLLPDGRIVLNAGSYTTHPVLRLQPNGQLDTSFGLNTATNFPDYGAVNTLQQLPNGHFLVGGDFYRFAGRSGCLLEFDADGQYVRNFRPQIGKIGHVNCLTLQPNGQILVGGTFSSLNGYPADNVGRLHANGDPDTVFNSHVSTDAPVAAIKLLPTGVVLIGGSFRRVGAVAAAGLARLASNGTPDAQFVPFPLPPSGTRSPVINAVLPLPNGNVLVGGNFYNASGNSLDPLVQVSASGTVFSTWSVPVSTQINCLALQPDGKVVVAGNKVYRFSATGQPDFSLQYSGSSSDMVYGLDVQPDGKLLMAGQIELAGTRYGLIRVLPNGTLDPAFAHVIRAGGLTTPRRVAVQPDGHILAIGGMRPAAVGYAYLYRMKADGNWDADLAGGANNSSGSVSAVLEQPNGALLVGGNFSEINGYQSFGLISLLAPTLTSTKPSNQEQLVQAYPNPVRDFCHVRLPAPPQRVALLDVTGRTVRTLPGGLAEVTFDVRHLPAGVYLLRVDYAEGPVTRRVVVQ